MHDLGFEGCISEAQIPSTTLSLLSLSIALRPLFVWLTCGSEYGDFLSQSLAG